MTSWEDLARRARVADVEAFNGCAADSATMNRVRQDVSAAHRLGVTGTPVVLMNGTRYRGTITEDELEELIQAALKSR